MKDAQYRRFVAVTFWVMLAVALSFLSLTVLTITHFVIKFW